MSAEDVKWRKPVLPGDVLVIELELTHGFAEKLARPRASAKWMAKPSARPKSLSCFATPFNEFMIYDIRYTRFQPTLIVYLYDTR